MGVYTINFSQEEKAEYLRAILELLNKGMYDTEVAERVGISVTSIKKFTQILIGEGKASKEQIEKKREERKSARKERELSELLESLEQGEGSKEIAEKLGWGESKVAKLKTELIKRGKITKEKIEEYKIQRQEREGTLDALDSKKKKVLEGVSNGETYKEISDYSGVGEARIKAIVKELKDRGFITSEQIEEARRNRRSQNQSDNVQDEKRQGEKSEEKGKQAKESTRSDMVKLDILSLLQLGVPSRKICEILDISHKLFSDEKEALIKMGKISEEKVKQAQKDKQQKDKEAVYQGLRDGLTAQEILDGIRYQTTNYVHRTQEKLISEKRITKKEIDEAKLNRREKRKMQLVHQGLLQGLTRQEIVDSDEQGELSLQMVATCQNKLIERGQITKDEIEKARDAREKIRQEATRNKYVGPHDDRIVQLFKLGFNGEQIAKAVGVGMSYISTRKKNLISKGKISADEIKLAIKSKQEKAEDRRKKIAEIIGFTRDCEMQLIQTHIAYAEANFQLGTPEKKAMLST